MPEIQMPKLSDTMTEGTLVLWKKKKGDKVSAGDIIAEIETDKATMEWESPEDGTLTEIYVEEGDKVNVGDKIAFIGGEGEEAPAEKKEEEKEEEKPAEATAEKKEEKPEEADAKKEEKKEQKETEKPAPAKEEEEETAPPQEKEEKWHRPPADESKEVHRRDADATKEEARVKASPVARRIAAELGVDLASVKSTGPDGRVTETDVRAAAKSKGAAQKPTPPGATPSIKPGE